MYLVPSFLFALSANIDSFIIGLSCGIRKTRFSLPQILLISLITLVGTMAALAVGEKLLSFFSFPYAKYTGKIILLLFGLYYVTKSFLMNLFHTILCRKNLKTVSSSLFTKKALSPSSKVEKETTSALSQQPLSWKNASLFGLSLSVNNLGIGLGVSIGGLEKLPTALISFFACIFFLLLGNHAGHCISFQKSERYADLFCGLLLILLSFFC